MSNILTSPLLWIGISILCFEAGIKIKNKFNYALLNPLILAAIFVFALLFVTKTDYETYNAGGSFITMFLTPATAVLAIPIYRQRKLLKENLLPILSGAFVGSLVSITSVILFSKLFGLDEIFMVSLVPKSVTTAIGLEISATLGGTQAITMIAIMISGIGGAIVMPGILKACKVEDSIAKGIAMGTASHAIGTSRALEMGETEGAMSGLAIGVAGLITVVLSLFIPYII